MSLNIVESLIDKLFFPLKGYEHPSIRKLTGSQNLLGSSDTYQSIPYVYHEPIQKSEYAYPGFFSLNRSMSDIKMNSMHSSETSNHPLVSQVPKLVSPSVLTFLQNSSNLQQKLLNNNTKNYNPLTNHLGVDLLYSAIETQTVANTICSLTESFKKVVSNELLAMTARVANIPKKDVRAETVRVANPSKRAMPEVKSHTDCSILNDEMANRKTKELQKRSKKRRRRQKKTQAESTKKHIDATLNMKAANGIKSQTHQVHPSLKTVSQSREGAKCDILCDIVKLTGKANSVQILLPDSSFLITVESACEDDSDWDNSACSDILTDFAEFELSGLFVTNLTSARTSASVTNGRTSKISTTSVPEDFEVTQLKSLLRRVNKNWNDSTKDIESTPKVTSKVSFAPDDELVKVVLVEMYDRKGEWEIYATERLRFKKRISEMESILSPCLAVEHRQKVFKRLHESNL